MKKALITGISGQDGYYLSQLLLEKGYEVHGLVRRNSQLSIGNLSKLDEKIQKKIIIHWGDITDHCIVEKIIKDIKPKEMYHLAAQSFVGLSFENPRHTYNVNIDGTLNVANAVREFSPKTRVYFAATSEMFGKVQETPQNEKTPFYPRSPYGVSKLAGFWTMKNYRESYGLFMSNGILFNHESEVRGPEFVTRKICMAVANISKKKQEYLELGNMDSRRDWGHAADYVYGMWLMLQYKKPDDFVLATGENHSVRDFVERAFKEVGIDIGWEGKELNEKGFDKKTKKVLVKVNPEFFRPADVEVLKGNYSKAKKQLGWKPRITFNKLVKVMMQNELNQ
ncbi:GDP-mannose 4,6-dehydratase [Candidatus Dojkabacteria bacterium]|nr:GDP-mannose 4,6-dehydratase [Candidatus Dojkabacteria bacterium]